MPGVLLYVGAGWDTYPLTVPALRAAHTHMVYVDGQPASGYYSQHVTTIDDLLRRLVKDGGKYCFAAGADAVFMQAADASWQAPLKDGCTLKYFVNTLDTQIAHHAGLSALLPLVTTLFMAGYGPRRGLEALLPSLERVYLTTGCDNELRFPRAAGVEYIHVRECKWNELCADDRFSVLNGNSDMLQLTSDAPFHYHWQR